MATRGERAAARAQWAQRGPVWDRSASGSPQATNPYNQVLIDAVGATVGHTILDLASGAGEPAINLALRVGAEGLVVATDFSPEMLAGARRRAAEAGLANIRFAIADMAALPWRDAAFDAVTCRFGVMFPPDPAVAVAEARRVLRPGGRAGYMVWGPMEANTAYHVVRRTILGFFGEDADKPISRHRFAAPGSIAGVLEGAGFGDVEERDLVEDREVSAGTPVWRERMQRSFALYTERLDDSGRARLDDELARAFEPLRHGDVYRLTAHARLCFGTAPA